MKFIADNIKKLSQKTKRKDSEKNLKEGIRLIRDRIKLRAKEGEDRCTVGFSETFDDNQKEIISDYFVKRNFKVEWCSNYRIVVRWV